MDFMVARIIYGYVMPITACFTITGNTLVLLVYGKQCYGGSRVRKASNTFLISISVSNILVALLPLPWYVYAFTFREVELNVTQENCYVWFLFETLLIIPHTGSVMLTCVLCIQRYTAIKYPLKANLWWSCRKALIVVFVIYIIDIAVHLVGISGIKMTSLTDNSSFLTSNNSTPAYSDCTSYAVYQDWIDDSTLFVITWFLFRSITVGVLPMIALVCTVVATAKLLQDRFSRNTGKVNLISISNFNIYHGNKSENDDENRDRLKKKIMTTPTRVIVNMAVTSMVVEICYSVFVFTHTVMVVLQEDTVLDQSFWDDTVRPVLFVCIFAGANTVFIHSCLMNRNFRIAIKELLKRCIP